MATSSDLRGADAARCVCGHGSDEHVHNHDLDCDPHCSRIHGALGGCLGEDPDNWDDDGDGYRSYWMCKCLAFKAATGS